MYDEELCGCCCFLDVQLSLFPFSLSRSLLFSFLLFLVLRHLHNHCTINTTALHIYKHFCRFCYKRQGDYYSPVIYVSAYTHAIHTNMVWTIHRHVNASTHRYIKEIVSASRSLALSLWCLNVIPKYTQTPMHTHTHTHTPIHMQSRNAESYHQNFSELKMIPTHNTIVIIFFGRGSTLSPHRQMSTERTIFNKLEILECRRIWSYLNVYLCCRSFARKPGIFSFAHGIFQTLMQLIPYTQHTEPKVDEKKLTPDDECTQQNAIILCTCTKCVHIYIETKRQPSDRERRKKLSPIILL